MVLEVVRPAPELALWLYELGADVGGSDLLQGDALRRHHLAHGTTDPLESEEFSFLELTLELLEKISRDPLYQSVLALWRTVGAVWAVASIQRGGRRDRGLVRHLEWL